MPEPYSHCSYCGSPFPANPGWPRICPSCGRTSYRNPLPVVVALLPVGPGLVVVRRNIEPSKGTLTLPGGYLDLGESWQQGTRRELLEETGIAIPAESIELYDVQSGLDDTLVIFGLAARTAGRGAAAIFLQRNPGSRPDRRPGGTRLCQPYPGGGGLLCRPQTPDSGHQGELATREEPPPPAAGAAGRFHPQRAIIPRGACRPRPVRHCHARLRHLAPGPRGGRRRHIPGWRPWHRNACR